MILNIKHIRTSLMVLSGFAFITKALPAEKEKPNIIIIYTDDQGYADLGCQGSDEIKTPHIDKLAVSGVRFTDAYVTAPQCMPSRAGLLTGKYQQKFGFYDNNSGPLPPDELTLGNHLQKAGYVTGSVGKWHLHVGTEKSEGRPGFRHYHGGAEMQPRNRGFDNYFSRAHNPQRSEQFYWASHNLKGEKLPPDTIIQTSLYRIDAQTEAALGFIKRNSKSPFFLYLAYFAPHEPLDATKKYLDRFSEIEDPKRRLGAAMISAMDDGVGKIVDILKEYGLEKNTLIVYMSDNGAPPNLSAGSVNHPLRGYKGSLYEGGIRVPLVMSWKNVLPQNRISNDPVMSLDISATVLSLASGSISDEVDGINLIPFLTKGTPMPDRYLYWSWRGQRAIRKGDWKFFDNDGKQYLFRISDDMEEKVNLIDEYPEIKTELVQALDDWELNLPPPQQPVNPVSKR